MIDATAADDARFSRQPCVARLPKLERLLSLSAHQLRRVEVKWVCVKCQMVVADASIQSFAATPCASASTLGVEACPVAPLAVRTAALEIHPSHRCSFFPRWFLTCCTGCGYYATTDPRSLKSSCRGPSPKGTENLRRLSKGLFPR
eukprot:6973536-Pyramimonas_sp.AAC.1